MKSLLIFIIQIFIIQSAIAQQAAPKANCIHCNMLVKDARFAAKVVDNAGTIIQFDAIECLVNFLKENEEGSYNQIQVANYERSNKWVDSKSATYLKSKAIASPMGAYLSAFSSREIAEKVRQEKGGELYDWETLKKLFKNSRFGLIDHPTHHHNRPDAYAPIGIMGDHLHHKGGFMVSLRYMTMQMDGNISGSKSVDNMTIFQDYMVAPQSMRMDMLMIGVMYAPTDKLTLMLMQNMLSKEMQLQTRMGMEFSTESTGLGDLKIGALYGLMSKVNSSIHINASVSLPTGSITIKDDTPMENGVRLPYPMQLGSGTVDLIGSATYKGSSELFSWGAQPLVTIRTDTNSEGYQWGNEYVLNAWLSFKLTNWMSIATQLTGKTQEELSGADDQLNPMMITTADTDNTGFTKFHSSLGLNFSFGDRDFFRDLKAGISYGIPIYQNVKGYQMNDQSNLNLGLRLSI